MSDKQDSNFVNHLLNSAFAGQTNRASMLRSLFDQKLLETRISLNQAAVSMDIDNKLLEKILDGEITQFDTLAIPKIAEFLDIDVNKVASMFFTMITASYKTEIAESKKNTYILNTFDLPLLKKIKFIPNITDQLAIESRIVNFFNLSSIQEYKSESVAIAYSSGARKSISGFSKSFWLRTAQELLAGIENPYEFDRDKLLEYVPQIRWHSTDVVHGMFQVIRSLYKLGVTVVYVPTIKDAHVRGATISHKSKPAIIISNYTDYYPTLFFVLLHEIFHVLFDWDEIFLNSYHVSNDDEYYTQHEAEANAFAREFFVSDQDLRTFQSISWSVQLVNEFAVKMSVHPSFYYLFDAFDRSKDDPKIFGRINKKVPAASLALEKLIDFNWNTPLSLKEINAIRNQKIYNL